MPRDQLLRAILRHNPHFDPLILDVYYDLALAWYMDAAALVAQAIHETGWFTSYRAVKLHNYAGIGATDSSVLGQSTKSVVEGVQRHFSHMHAYVGQAVSPLAQAYDDRYNIVRKLYPQRITYIEELGGKWAPAQSYGYSIAQLYTELSKA